MKGQVQQVKITSNYKALYSFARYARSLCETFIIYEEKEFGIQISKNTLKCAIKFHEVSSSTIKYQDDT